MKAKQDAPNYLVYLAIAKIVSVNKGRWREDNRIVLSNRVHVSDLRSSQFQIIVYHQGQKGGVEN